MQVKQNSIAKAERKRRLSLQGFFMRFILCVGNEYISMKKHRNLKVKRDKNDILLEEAFTSIFHSNLTVTDLT